MLLPKLLLVSLCVAAVLAGSSSSSSSEEKKIKDKRGKCTEVVQRPPSGDCILIESLKKILLQIEVDVKIKVEFETLIETINKKIILNEAYGELEIFVLASYRLKTFVFKYAVLLEQIQYLEIGTWGLINDLFVISTEIKGEDAEKLIVAEPGETNEIVATLEQISVLLSEEMQEVLEELIVELNKIFVGTLPYPKKMAKCGKLFKKYIKENPGLAGIPNFKIGKWGTFAEFFDVTVQYERVELVPELITWVPDGSQKVVSLILELEATLTVASYKWTKLERKVLRMFFSSLKFLTIDESLTHEQVIKIISTQFLELVKVEPLLRGRLRSIKIGGEIGFGTFGDLVDLFVFLSLENARLSTTVLPTTVSGSPGEATTVTAADGTTVAKTTVARATTPAPTKAAPLEGDCAEAGEVLEIPNGGNVNQTILISSYYDAALAWDSMMVRANFNVLIYQVATKIILNSEIPAAEKIPRVIVALEQFMGADEVRKQLVSNIVIKGWGTNTQLLACKK